MEKRGREKRGRKRRLLKGGGDTLLALVWSTPPNVQLSQESAPMPGISHLCEYTGQIYAPLVLPKIVRTNNRDFLLQTLSDEMFDAISFKNVS